MRASHDLETDLNLRRDLTGRRRRISMVISGGRSRDLIRCVDLGFLGWIRVWYLAEFFELPLMRDVVGWRWSGEEDEVGIRQNQHKSQGEIIERKPKRTGDSLMSRACSRILTLRKVRNRMRSQELVKYE
ncbi:protein belonging to Lysylphosphatidylglycerolsynthetase/UPF0104 [Striga asiatica]|uniref:Protein belonging to Lysylphosphatidylglycerolsynthetase/UPF0104 n=1 Tax=Striga asiatica TaxID=4170 RepID=A0A5A7Q700_STRAF|nr:protein belonging to Lysylphosphatidylglycerolsynthetase/UPF0104 [Striga asiatica]